MYDVLRDSSGDRYLAVHLDQNGLPVKQIEPVVSERPIVSTFEFNILEELIQSQAMLYLYEIVLILSAFFVVPILNELLKD